MGRGSSGGGGNLPSRGSGVNPKNIKNLRDLVSERERKQAEVDDILTAAREIHNLYGVDVGQFMLADVGGKDSSTMAFSDGENIGFNTRFFDSGNMTKAFDDCVKSGFHPSRGQKPAMEAVAAHEYGHVLTERAAQRLGISGVNSIDNASKVIIDRATKRLNYKGSVRLATPISGYAKYSNAECVAEALADVYCNGRKAKVESRTIATVMSEILK